MLLAHRNSSVGARARPKVDHEPNRVRFSKFNAHEIYGEQGLGIDAIRQLSCEIEGPHKDRFQEDKSSDLLSVRKCGMERDISAIGVSAQQDRTAAVLDQLADGIRHGPGWFGKPDPASP